MGGKNSSGPSRAEMATQAYQAGTQGRSWFEVHQASGGGGQDLLDAWQAGRNTMQPSHDPFAAFLHGAGGAHGGSHSAPSASASAEVTYEQQLADQKKAQEEAQAAADRAAGIQERDQLFSAYMDAAGSATDFINSEITREQSNARLLGIDYSIDDETKSTRINDYFASVWGAGEQSRLEALMGRWGNPQGFDGWTVTRGDGSAYAGSGAEEETEGVSVGQRPSTIITEDEEDSLGGTANVLGV